MKNAYHADNNHKKATSAILLVEQWDGNLANTWTT